MPRKSKRPCSHPGCPNLTEDKYCEEHKSLHPDRPSAAKRGYGSKWQRVSKAYLRRHPLCVRCKAQGRFTAATGRLFASPAMTARRGQKTEIPSIGIDCV